MPIFTPFTFVAPIQAEPVPAWDPSSLTNALYWWRADQGITTSGTTVTAWTDILQSETLNYTGTPTFNSSVSTMANKPGIEYNNTNDRLEKLISYTFSSGLSWWFVIYTGPNAQGGYQILGGDAASATASEELVLETNHPSYANSYSFYYYQWPGMPSGTTVNTGISISNPEKAWVAQSYTPANPTNATVELWRNGSSVFSNTGTGPGQAIAGGIQFNVGNYSSFGGDIAYVGTIMECGITDGPFPSADASNMDSYCSARYGI